MLTNDLFFVRVKIKPKKCWIRDPAFFSLFGGTKKDLKSAEFIENFYSVGYKFILVCFFFYLGAVDGNERIENLADAKQKIQVENGWNVTSMIFISALRLELSALDAFYCSPLIRFDLLQGKKLSLLMFLQCKRSVA